MQSIQPKTQRLGWFRLQTNVMHAAVPGARKIVRTDSYRVVFDRCSQLSDDASLCVCVCVCVLFRCARKYLCTHEFQMDKQETGSAHLIWCHSILKTLDWCALCLRARLPVSQSANVVVCMLRQRLRLLLLLYECACVFIQVLCV